jgi:pyridoxal/pyridoxine/pyridoxamine kinase
MKKQPKSVRRIINAFLEMRASRPLEKIMVTELCEKADIITPNLTEACILLGETYRENHRRQAEEFLDPLTDDEKTALAEILRKLIDAKKENE